MRNSMFAISYTNLNDEVDKANFLHNSGFFGEDLDACILEGDDDKKVNSIVMIEECFIKSSSRDKKIGSKLFQSLVSIFPDSLIVVFVGTYRDEYVKDIYGEDNSNIDVSRLIEFIEEQDFLDISLLTGYEHRSIYVYNNEVGKYVESRVDSQCIECDFSKDG